MWGAHWSKFDWFMMNFVHNYTKVDHIYSVSKLVILKQILGEKNTFSYKIVSNVTIWVSFRSSCYSHCCGCVCGPAHYEYPSLPTSYYNCGAGSTYDLNHCTSCGSSLRSNTTSNNNIQPQPRLFSKNRSSQRFIKQEPWEPMHTRSKSLRWTKEQLEKFDNLIVPSNE